MKLLRREMLIASGLLPLLHSMFSVHNETLDNDRYMDVEWRGATEIISII